MRTLKHVFMLLLAMLLAAPASYAQKVDVEKIYEISGKAKRGYLGGVEYDEASQVYSLTYVTKSTAKIGRFETYKFDKDFNFIEMVEEEVEFTKAKGKFKWFDFGGEELSGELLTVENNMVGQLVLKKGKFYRRWDWLNGGYYVDYDLTEKTKPKDPEGRKLSMIAYVTDAPSDRLTYYGGWSWLGTGTTKDYSAATGDVTVVCSVVGTMKDAKAGALKYEYVTMRISASDLTIKQEEKFEFSSPQSLVATRILPNGDFAFVFAPVNAGKKAAIDPLGFTYMRVASTDCKVKERIEFKSLNSYWDVADITLTDKGDVLIYGPANSKNNDKYYSEQIGAEKFSDFMIMKITNGKLAWVSNTNLDEFEAKLQAPPSQKKAPAYKGKKFAIGGLEIAPNGDMLIYGQNYKVKDDGLDYTDVVVFHFDDKGKLKSQYGLDVLESNKYAKSVFSESLFASSADAKSMYWIIFEIAGIKGGDKPRQLNYARIGKVNLAGATVGDFLALGQGKGDKYYLENSFPILPSKDGNKLTFFGSNKGGRTLWFCRVALD